MAAKRGSKKSENGNKIVYWLKTANDLKNLVSGFPLAPVLSYKLNKFMYVVHSPGDIVFILESDTPVTQIETHFAAQTKVNIVEIARVRSMTIPQLSNYLQGGKL